MMLMRGAVPTAVIAVLLATILILSVQTSLAAMGGATIALVTGRSAENFKGDDIARGPHPAWTISAS